MPDYIACADVAGEAVSPGSSTSTVLASVVVSTCNGCGKLPRLFDALSAQTVNGKLNWELILVDNRSTDKTAEVTRSYAAQSPFPITYIFEGRQGKSYGLNTGINAASGEVLAFTDDDGVPARDWLERIVARFEIDRGANCLGGRVELFDPNDVLVTVRRSRDVVIVDASEFTPVNIPVIGCNVAFRASVFREIGLFDTDLGPGSKCGVAEDLDLLYRLVRAGHRIVYDPEIVVLHNHGRRSSEQVGSVLKGYVLGRGAFYCKHIRMRDRTVLRWTYWEVRSHLSNWAKGWGVSREARRAFRDLSLLGRGAWRYLRHQRSVTRHQGSLAQLADTQH